MRARLVPAGLLLTLNIRRVATAWSQLHRSAPPFHADGPSATDP